MRLRSLLLLVPLFCVGCAGRYFYDRGRDALDIITLQVGFGIGGKVRLGPVQTGALIDVPLTGLKGGEFGWWYPDGGNVFDAQVIVLGFDFYVPRTDHPERSKGYEAYPILPFVQLPQEAYDGGALAYDTQLEAVLGAGPTVRVGFNPGELIDFILGWTTLDLYGDDVVPEERTTF